MYYHIIIIAYIIELIIVHLSEINMFLLGYTTWHFKLFFKMVILFIYLWKLTWIEWILRTLTLWTRFCPSHGQPYLLLIHVAEWQFMKMMNVVKVTTNHYAYT